MLRPGSGAGGAVSVSLDLAGAEARYRTELVETVTADRLYDRAWALDLLDVALRDLEADYRTTGDAAGTQPTARTPGARSGPWTGRASPAGHPGLPGRGRL